MDKAHERVRTTRVPPQLASAETAAHNQVSCMRQSTKSGDRRVNPRYKVVLDVRWKVVHRKRVLYSGTGSTVDFSSGGIQFDTDEPPSVGRTIEMSIAWPALLDKAIPLRLAVEGRVVRTTGQRVAVDIRRFEFRTAGW